MPKGVPKAGFRRTKNQQNGKVTITKVNPVDLTAITESRFSIDERFGFIGDMVTMLCKGEQPSVIVAGPGGLGKTHTVLKTMQKNGMRDITLAEIGATNSKKNYKQITGFSTAKGLYRTLYENRNGILVFDDCDAVLQNKDAICLLKGALDSYDRRIISWNADFKDDELPNSFEFKGRVIFITNNPSCTLDQAIITRSMVVDVSMTSKQKVERMRTIAMEADFMPGVSKEMKIEALDLIEVLCDRVKELSLRSLIQVTKIRKSAGAKWKDLAEYAICG